MVYHNSYWYRKEKKTTCTEIQKQCKQKGIKMFHKYYNCGIAKMFVLPYERSLKIQTVNLDVLEKIFKFGSFYEHILEDNKIEVVLNILI